MNNLRVRFNQEQGLVVPAEFSLDYMSGQGPVELTIDDELMRFENPRALIDSVISVLSSMLPGDFSVATNYSTNLVGLVPKEDGRNYIRNLTTQIFLR